MAPFYGWGSTASRLEPLRRGSLLFTNKFPAISGTHFTHLGRMKGWVDLGATQWFFEHGTPGLGIQRLDHLAIKLPCLPLISIVTGSANWEAKVKPIFIMVIIFMWPPLQSRVWRMSCLRVRYCFICVVMSWYLRMRRTSVLGKHFCSVLLFFTINYGLELALRFGLSVDPVLYCLATQRLGLKLNQKLNFYGCSVAVEKSLYKTLQAGIKLREAQK